MAIGKLTPLQIGTALTDLPGWAVDADKMALYREIRLADFAETFALMTRIALAAEKADHHPEWSNVYNRLSIRLTTHEAGGITTRDLALAEAINGFLGEKRE
ncbi:MAG: 4a-hydroxytetrahydrobiopterin dehydratase [Sphingobium sp.]